MKQRTFWVVLVVIDVIPKIWCIPPLEQDKDA